MKIYLAVPYAGMENISFIKVNQKAADLISDGHIVFSPISHSHHIALQCDIPSNWEVWINIDRSFIEWCDEVWVYTLNGWKKSKGVKAEIAIAKELGKTIRYIEDNSLWKSRPKP